LEPSRPFSSPVKAQKRMLRFGAGSFACLEVVGHLDQQRHIGCVVQRAVV
jgi:hypothetical protein